MAKTKKEVFATRRERRLANEIKNLKAENQELQLELDDSRLLKKLGEAEIEGLRGQITALKDTISSQDTELADARNEVEHHKKRADSNFDIAYTTNEQLKSAKIDREALKRVLGMYFTISK